MSKLRNLCKAIQDARVCDVDNVPDGWFKCMDLANECNVSLPTIHRKMRVLIKNGEVETRKFKVQTCRGTYPVIHYRYAKTTKKPA